MAIVRHRFSPPDYVPGSYWHVGNWPSGNVVLSRGVYDFGYFYYLLHEYLIEEGWATREEADFRERMFLQRDTAHGQELWIFWRMKKASPDKLFHFELDFNWHVVGMQKTEVMIKDKKRTINKGESEIKYFPRIVLNQDFANHWTWKYFNKFIIKRILHKRYEWVRRECLRDVEKLHEALKTYFDIETYSEEPELRKFYGVRGME